MCAKRKRLTPVTLPREQTKATDRRSLRAQTDKRSNSYALAEGKSTSSTGHSQDELVRQTTQKRTQWVISTYHTLIRRLEVAKRNGDSDAECKIQQQIDEIGGLHSYQRASARAGGEQDGKAACSKWLALQLTKLRNAYKEARKVSKENDNTNVIITSAQHSVANARKVRLLDVGALDGSAYERYRSWIDPVYIDINPQAPNVVKEDFYDRPLPENDDGRFDIVALSLVVNFVADPSKRGEMLFKAQKFLRKDGGYVFMVLPLPCVSNSRYLTEAHLANIVTEMGYTIVEKHKSLRLVFYLFEYVPKEDGKQNRSMKEFPKRIISDGPKRNNFCIVVEPNLHL